MDVLAVGALPDARACVGFVSPPSFLPSFIHSLIPPSREGAGRPAPTAPRNQPGPRRHPAFSERNQARLGCPPDPQEPGGTSHGPPRPRTHTPTRPRPPPRFSASPEQSPGPRRGAPRGAQKRPGSPSPPRLLACSRACVRAARPPPTRPRPARSRPLLTSPGSRSSEEASLAPSRLKPLRALAAPRSVLAADWPAPLRPSAAHWSV